MASKSKNDAQDLISELEITRNTAQLGSVVAGGVVLMLLSGLL